MVNDLLEVSKLEILAMQVNIPANLCWLEMMRVLPQLECIPYCVRELCEAVAASFRFRSQALLGANCASDRRPLVRPGVDLVLLVDDKVPTTVWGDPTRVRQIMYDSLWLFDCLLIAAPAAVPT